jgi:hypothetical protein
MRSIRGLSAAASWLLGDPNGLLAVVGAIYEVVASTQDAVRYPLPGRIVDVGGYNVHVLCMGEGSPTILLDAWAGAWTTDWSTTSSCAPTAHSATARSSWCRRCHN